MYLKKHIKIETFLIKIDFSLYIESILGYNRTPILSELLNAVMDVRA